MATTPKTWLSVPEAVEALGITQRSVRNVLTDRRILAVHRGEAAALAISSLTLVDEGGKAVILPSLRGTLTALSDTGCSNEEVWRWLAAVNGGLGEHPIDALRIGRIHAMRRVAATLAF